MNKKIFLIEDHDEALKVWREEKVNHLDLVHIDAHIDFGYHPIRPIARVFKEAKSLKDLKSNLEKALAFMRYEKDLDKQTNIGNYIYQAMEEGMVRNFYWVIPGGLKEFKQSTRFIKGIIKSLNFHTKQTRQAKLCLSKGLIETQLLGRNFVICILEGLPPLKQKVLLDIDTDFLAIDSLLNADSAARIGKRRPWILPQELVEILKEKMKRPQIITIAYSVNGGYTPMRYKHLGDEMAFLFAPEDVGRNFKNNSQAAQHFNSFLSTGEKEDYQKAVKLNPSYRAADNNYGPLYFALRKFSLAQNEFLKVLRVDRENPACLCGLGGIALERRDFQKAKNYFSSAVDYANNEPNRLNELNLNHKLFSKVKNQSLFGLARAEFSLRNFKRAKELLLHYKTVEPLRPQSYYLLGRIYEKEREFLNAVVCYKDALRLGFTNIEITPRLLKIAGHLKEKDELMEYIITRYKDFKRDFLRTKRLNAKKKKKIKGLPKIEEQMADLEQKLKKRLSKRTI